MSTVPPAPPVSDTANTGSIYLSALLGRPLADRGGQSLGNLADVIVRLRGAEYPLVTGLVGAVGGREVFVPIEQVSSLDGEVLKLASARLDLRQFERRDGEVLLRADVLGHRLIDVSPARLVRAGDLRLSRTDGDWVLDAVDTRWRPRRLFGLLGRREQPHEARDWREFEPLIGHARSAVLRGPFARIRRLKPAQIADLLEDASKEEETEILGHVHADPELEADVFEELDEELATRLLGARTDAEIAEVLARMRADDAADTVAELPQRRRPGVLDLLPAGQRTKVLTLMGFNPTSAGGLMGVDFLALAADVTGRRRSGGGHPIRQPAAGGADQRPRRQRRPPPARRGPPGHPAAVRSGQGSPGRVRHRSGPDRSGHRRDGRRGAYGRLQPDHDPGRG